MTEDEALMWIARKMVESSKPGGQFGYRGPEALGTTWAFARISVTRDCGPAKIASFERAQARLERKHPGDYVARRFSHWGPGWIDHVLVRMFDDTGAITQAGRETVDRLRRQRFADNLVELQEMVEAKAGALRS